MNDTPQKMCLDSLARCQKQHDFLEQFYERFVASSKEVKAQFANTDMAGQKQMVIKSLELTVAATSGDARGFRELILRAETHSRENLDIPPHLYKFWLDAILKTARKCDPLWNADIKRAWEHCLQVVIKYMTDRY